MNESYAIKEADKSILLALARFHYLTADQTNRLLYPTNSDGNRYVQRLLKRLVDAEYLLRLRALPMPRYGQAPHVFALGKRGRQYLHALGVEVEPYFRPSEERRATENSPFMTHRLAAIDVMIAADRLCKGSEVICPQMLSERELKRGAVKVDVPASKRGMQQARRRVAVIPDAWFQLSPGAGKAPFSISLELDRGTEDQRAWRQKVAAYSVWASGPYQTAFDTDNLTIAVVCPDMTRELMLMEWTLKELRAREAEELSELFLFTFASPVSTPPLRFFFGKLWRVPGTTQSTSLLPFGLPVAERNEAVLFQTV